MGSALKGLHNIIKDPVGKLLGSDDSGDGGAAAAAAEAARVKAEADAAKAANEAALNNMNANFKADLSNSDVAKVEVGGSADASTVDSITKRKKVAGGTLSSTLGLNV